MEPPTARTVVVVVKEKLGTFGPRAGEAPRA
jgi:hypothetical protein